MVRHRGLRVAHVGVPVDLTYEVSHLGDGAAALTELLAGKSPFSSVLQTAARPAVVVGTGALQRADGAAIGALASSIASAAGCVDAASGWNGYGLLHANSSAVGALDVGFVPGPSAAPASSASVVYLLGADSLPPIHSDAFVVYQGHHGDEGAQRADLVLPGAAYTEKAATYVNTEGRAQRTARAVDAPGDAREDWKVIVALSKVVGKPLPYDSVGGVRARMAAICPALGDASGAALEHTSADLATLALAAAPEVAAGGKADAAPLRSGLDNFYMSDAVSRASATMAKCVQAFGTRA